MTNKILIVDDDFLVREALDRIIHRYSRNNDAKISVRKAENGEQAIALAKEDRPDIILMDVRMPVMDGIQACSILRSNPLFDPTYIILLTGDVTGEVKGLSIGADDYITKPFDSAALLLRIAHGLEVAAKRSVVIQDSKTGFWTREYFNNCRLEGELGRAKRHGRPLSFLMVRFKEHSCSDGEEPAHLTLVDDWTRAIPTRRSDICVRWDERTFAVLMPETELDGAMFVADEVKKRFLEISEDLDVTVGISHFDMETQISALPAFAETSLAVALDTGGIVVNGKPVSEGGTLCPSAQV